MKNEDRYYDLVRQATTKVSEYILGWSRRNDKEGWGEHEATWKALLFCELIHIDEKVKDGLSLENKANTRNKEIWKKKFDLWLLDPGNSVNYVLEVKWIRYVRQKTHPGLREVHAEKDSVYCDLIKLEKAVKSRRKRDIKGIAVAVSRNNVDAKEIIKLFKPRITDLLSEDLKLLVCSNGNCEYA